MFNTVSNYKDKVSRIIGWGHWFSFINILVALLISSRYLFIASWPGTLGGRLYFFISWLGHFSFLIFVFYLLTLFPLSFLIPKQKIYRFLACIIASIGLTLLVIDTQVFKQFHFHLNPLVLELLTDMDSEQALSWQLFYILLPLFLCFELFASNLLWRKQKRLNKYNVGSVAAMFFLSCFFLTHLIYIWADAALYRPILSQKANYPLSYPMTAKGFLVEHGILDLQHYSQKAKRQSVYKIDELRYPLRPIELDHSSDTPNLLLIVVDSLRFDMLNNTHMPNLWHFSHQAHRFNHHFSGSNNSQFGIFGLFYGIPAHYWQDISISKQPPVLIQTLQQRQYQFYLDASAGFSSSEFSRTSFGTLPSLNIEEKAGGVNGDIAMLQHWKAWLAQNKANVDSEQPSTKSTPWFSFLMFDSVAKNQIPAEFTTPFGPSTSTPLSIKPNSKIKPQLKRNYENAVYYVDSLLSDVFTTLKQQNALENTAVIITSNNGQEFNDTGKNNWGNGSNYSKYQTQVPLVIYYPDKAPAVIEQDTSHLDIAPTLMEEVLKVTTNKRDYSSGLNLFDLHKRSWVLVGDSGDYVIYEKDKIVQFNKRGDYQTFNRDYQRISSQGDNIQIFLSVLNELERFYRPK